MSGPRRKTVTDKHGNKLIFSMSLNSEVKIDVKPNPMQTKKRDNYMSLSDGNVRGIRNWLNSVLDNK